MREDVFGFPAAEIEPGPGRQEVETGLRHRSAALARQHGIKPLADKALRVEMLREDRADESEFVTISYWESVAAMSRFAGKDPRRIHHLERDAEFLLELPKAVQILEIVASH